MLSHNFHFDYLCFTFNFPYELKSLLEYKPWAEQFSSLFVICWHRMKMDSMKLLVFSFYLCLPQGSPGRERVATQLATDGVWEGTEPCKCALKQDKQLSHYAAKGLLSHQAVMVIWYVVLSCCRFFQEWRLLLPTQRLKDPWETPI